MVDPCVMAVFPSLHHIDTLESVRVSSFVLLQGLSSSLMKRRHSQDEACSRFQMRIYIKYILNPTVDIIQTFICPLIIENKLI